MSGDVRAIGKAAAGVQRLISSLTTEDIPVSLTALITALNQNASSSHDQGSRTDKMMYELIMAMSEITETPNWTERLEIVRRARTNDANAARFNRLRHLRNAFSALYNYTSTRRPSTASASASPSRAPVLKKRHHSVAVLPGPTLASSLSISQLMDTPPAPTDFNTLAMMLDSPRELMSAFTSQASSSVKRPGWASSKKLPTLVENEAEDEMRSSSRRQSSDLPGRPATPSAGRIAGRSTTPAQPETDPATRAQQLPEVPDTPLPRAGRRYYYTSSAPESETSVVEQEDSDSDSNDDDIVTERSAILRSSASADWAAREDLEAAALHRACRLMRGSLVSWRTQAKAHTFAISMNRRVACDALRIWQEELSRARRIEQAAEYHETKVLTRTMADWKESKEAQRVDDGKAVATVDRARLERGLAVWRREARLHGLYEQHRQAKETGSVTSNFAHWRGLTWDIVAARDASRACVERRLRKSLAKWTRAFELMQLYHQHIARQQTKTKTATMAHWVGVLDLVQTEQRVIARREELSKQSVLAQWRLRAATRARHRAVLEDKRRAELSTVMGLWRRKARITQAFEIAQLAHNRAIAKEILFAWAEVAHRQAHAEERRMVLASRFAALSPATRQRAMLVLGQLCLGRGESMPALRDSARVALLAWAAAARQRRRKWENMRLARQFDHESTLYRVFVALWENRRAQQQWRVAVAFHDKRIVPKTYRALRDFNRRRRKCELAESMTVNRVSAKLRVESLRHWYRMTVLEHTSRDLKGILNKRHNPLRHAFETMVRVYDDGVHAASVSHNLHAVRSYHTEREVFLAWRVYASRRAAHHAALDATGQIVDTSRVNAVFRAWRAWSVMVRLERAAADVMSKNHSRAIALNSLSAWSDLTLSRVSARRSGRMLAEIRVERVTSGVFYRWKAMAQDRKEVGSKEVAAAEYAAQRVLRACLDSWAGPELL
ncbi:SFI1 [Carpediemonas membranifera]|uniref:SFI1 n=1 Tax=Carpediemonas membranifera TaxID=201153 RepID=A0A8J6ARI8_9EUKA|nr:SFI1 [Carpediemonas membranifera]|eukprot:KAG9389610.1 SFI1 [Carpediemonas membranifera]